ncbi:replication-relaxation family protein [Streptomyces sp. NPDC057621]|uniref:replication-relaxation family protein n=1 Tax=Streptomyces sp. NPDC057621 TaxID=3346186 RepID=UPI0036C2BFE6
MVNVDAGGGDRLALAVLVQYRMATTQQLHLLTAPGVRIEQTRRRLGELRSEGLVDHITLAQAGRTRVWFATGYGVRIASAWPELRDQPRRHAADRTAVRLKAGHGLTVTEVGLAFVQDARHRGETCRPLDWIAEVHHPLGGSEAVIADALLYYRRGDADHGSGGAMLRAFVEVDRATMGPERLAAKIGAYARLHRYVPAPARRRRQPFTQQATEEAWKQHYPLFPRLLFILDGTGPAGIEHRVRALHAAATDTALYGFPHEVPILTAALADLLREGPSAPVWRPALAPDQRVSWMHTGRLHCPSPPTGPPTVRIPG